MRTVKRLGPAAMLLLLAAVGATPARRPDLPMHRYILGLAWSGPAWTPERTPATDSLQRAHLANIGRMFERRVLVSAGPFGDDTPLQGLFVFDGDSAAVIPLLLQGDPAVASGRLRVEMFPLVAPAGLGEEYRRRGATATGMPDSMVTFQMVFLRRGRAYSSAMTPAIGKTLAAHRDYMDRLGASGRLIFAGSVDGTGDLRGLLVFAADSAETHRLVAADPGVRRGRFKPETHPWWTAWGTIPGH